MKCLAKICALIQIVKACIKYVADMSKKNPCECIIKYFIYCLLKEWGEKERRR